MCLCHLHVVDFPTGKAPGAPIRSARQDACGVGSDRRARDIEVPAANAVEPAGLMKGVEIFEPDRSGVSTGPDECVEAGKPATGS